MAEFIFGSVKYFDPKKGFGFINGTGKGVFFHLSDFSNLKVEDGQIKWGTTRNNNKDIHPGTELVYTQTTGRKGKKAHQWAFLSSYKALARAQSQDIVNDQKYRVMSEYRMMGETSAMPASPKFTGTLAELRCEYPKTGDYRTDKLCPSFSCSDFDERIWVEMLDSSGEWHHCKDPR
jgi:cold shock CspA family protein